MTGGWISSSSGNKYSILRTEAILLIAGGLASAIMTYAHIISVRTTGKRPPALTENLKHDALILTGFLCGCLIGALAGKFVGLSGLFIPGILLLGIRKTD